jgi:hypothetical protein
MKSHWKELLLTVTSVALCLTLMASHSRAGEGGASRHHCTNKILTGIYGLSFSGSVFVLGPGAGTAQLTFDGAGGLTGSYTETVDGTLKHGQFTGTYAVNADCTTSATVTGLVPGSWTVNLDGTIVEHGHRIYMVETDDGTAVTGVASSL